MGLSRARSHDMEGRSDGERSETSRADRAGAEGAVEPGDGVACEALGSGCARTGHGLARWAESSPRREGDSEGSRLVMYAQRINGHSGRDAPHIPPSPWGFGVLGSFELPQNSEAGERKPTAASGTCAVGQGRCVWKCGTCATDCFVGRKDVSDRHVVHRFPGSGGRVVLDRTTSSVGSGSGEAGRSPPSASASSCPASRPFSRCC